MIQTEELFEIILEMVLEGTVEAATNKRVPLPARIFAAAVLILLFGGVVFVIIFVGILFLNGSFNEVGTGGGIALGILMFAIAGLILGAGIRKFVKTLENRRYYENLENDENDEYRED